MDLYQTEAEQIAALKSWLKYYGKTVLTGIVLGLVIILCWYLWSEHKQTQNEHAALLFQDVLDAQLNLRTASVSSSPLNTTDSEEQKDVVNERLVTFKTLASQFMEQFPETYYAHWSAWLLAKNAIETGEFTAAQQHLEWVLEHKPSRETRLITQWRLAHVLLDQDEAQAALDLLIKQKLKNEVDDVMKYLYESLKGDIYVQLKQIEQARKAYKLALEYVNSDQRPLLLMKYNDLLNSVD